MRRSRRVRVPIVVAALTLVTVALGACDSDGEDIVPATEGSPTATMTASPAPPVTGTQTPTVEPTSSPSPSPAPETPTRAPVLQFETETFSVPAGARPHDVAPAVDGGIWYTAQRQAALGYLDPDSGEVEQIPLAAGSAPHGVIVGPEGDAWVTDGGLNAIVRVDAETREVTVYPLPPERAGANLNTAAFDGRGRIWFTGQAGIFGVLDPATEEMQVFDAPRGRGPYGITGTPSGDVWFSSLAGSYIARVDLDDLGTLEVFDPPTPDAGARRVWSDSQGRLWVSEWNAGQVAMFDPVTETWREWPLPAEGARAYAVYVDEYDAVWVSDFGSDSLWRFDPQREEFARAFPVPGEPGNVRQILGRAGEVWVPASADDSIMVIRYRPE